MSHVPVCAKCELALIPKEAGVYMLEMFGDPPRPYKLWRADLWACVECGAEIVMGYGGRAIGEHWQENFAETLATIEARGETLVREHERLGPQ